MEELVLNIFLLPGIASQQFVYLVNNLPLVNKLKTQNSNFEKSSTLCDFVFKYFSSLCTLPVSITLIFKKKELKKNTKPFIP